MRTISQVPKKKEATKVFGPTRVLWTIRQCPMKGALEEHRNSQHQGSARSTLLIRDEHKHLGLRRGLKAFKEPPGLVAWEDSAQESSRKS